MATEDDIEKSEALRQLKSEFARRRGQKSRGKAPASKELVPNAGPWSPTAICESCKSYRTVIIGTDTVRGIRWHRCECGRKFATAMEDIEEFADDTKILKHDGKCHTLAEWASQRGMTPQAILARIKIGWSVAEAIETPKGKRRKRKAPRNRKASRLSYNGQRLSIHDWAQRTGLSKALINNRLRNGWSVEATLTTAPDKQITGRKPVILQHNGLCLTLKQWAERTGLSYGLIQRRIRSGWTVARALTQPANSIRPRTAKEKRVKADIHNAVRYAHDGQILTVSQWGELLGIKAATIRKRIRHGMSMADALAPARQYRHPVDGLPCQFCGSTRTYIEKKRINKGCRAHRCHNCDKTFNVPISESGEESNGNAE